MQEQLALPEPPPPAPEPAAPAALAAPAAPQSAYANGTNKAPAPASTNGDLLGDLLAPLALEAPPISTPSPLTQSADPGEPLALALYDQQNQIKVNFLHVCCISPGPHFNLLLDDLAVQLDLDICQNIWCL
jgi:hypothetical protein